MIQLIGCIVWGLSYLGLPGADIALMMDSSEDLDTLNELLFFIVTMGPSMAIFLLFAVMGFGDAFDMWDRDNDGC
jgi:hypothetical protein